MQSPRVRVVFFLLAASLPAGGLGYRTAGASASLGGLTPVEKVVHLLKDLKLKIDADQKSEEKVYNKYACWCKDTTERKAEFISASNAKMNELTQEILTQKATVAIAEGEIAKLTKQIQENEELQAKLTAHRQKQNANWQKESEFMKSVLASLQEAIKVLNEHTKGGVFLQDAESQGRLRSAVRAVIDALPLRSHSILKQRHLALLGNFATGASGYAPQSMTVQGILADMYTTFATDLQGATATEASQNRVYEKTIFELETELAKLQKNKAEQEAIRDEAKQKLAVALEDYENTKAARDAATKFFGETSAACMAKKAEWDTRQELRAEELEGVEKAISLLSTDDARELFDSAIKVGKETNVDYSLDPTSFVQISGESRTEASVRAACRNVYRILSAGAKEAHSLRLAFLAARVRKLQASGASGADGFSEVLHQIDTMIAELKEEDLMDIANRDDCIAQLDKNTEEKKQLVWEIGRLEQKIAKLEAHQEAVEEEITATDLEKNNTIEERTELIAQREADNEAWLARKADDQAAVHLLGQVLEVLNKYYANHSIEMGPVQGEVKGLVLIREHRGEPVFNISEDQAPEAVLTKGSSRAGETKPIISALTMLRQDLEDEIRNDLKAEMASNDAFLAQNATLNALEKKLIQHISDLQEERSVTIDKINKAEVVKGQTENERDQRVARIADLKKNNCDFILATFKDRATKRAIEVSGLVEAKDFLAKYMVNTKKLLTSQKGWKEEQLLQVPEKKDGSLLSLRFLKLAV